MARGIGSINGLTFNQGLHYPLQFPVSWTSGTRIKRRSQVLKARIRQIVFTFFASHEPIRMAWYVVPHPAVKWLSTFFLVYVVIWFIQGPKCDSWQRAIIPFEYVLVNGVTTQSKPPCFSTPSDKVFLPLWRHFEKIPTLVSTIFHVVWPCFVLIWKQVAGTLKIFPAQTTAAWLTNQREGKLAYLQNQKNRHHTYATLEFN